MTDGEAPVDCQLLTASHDLAEWDEFVDLSPQGTLFCKSEWLRAVLEDSFEIAVCRDSAGIRAGLPLPLAGRSKSRAVVRPPMSGTMGLLLRPPRDDRKYERELSDEMAALTELEAALPRYRSFTIACHPTVCNWLPFYWAGYQQTTSYTYVLPSIRDVEAVREEMDYSKRKNLKKAEREVSIDEAACIDELYDHHTDTLRRQGATISYRRDYLRRIHNAAERVGDVVILRAIAEKAGTHAMIMVAWDRRSAYYLVSSIDPEFRSSGAATLLLLRAIERVRPSTDRFDFEGSMIPGVERSFRKFGARQTPYFVVSRGSDVRLQAMKLGERVMRRLGFKE